MAGSFRILLIIFISCTLVPSDTLAQRNYSSYNKQTLQSLRYSNAFISTFYNTGKVNGYKIASSLPGFGIGGQMYRVGVTLNYERYATRNKLLYSNDGSTFSEDNFLLHAYKVRALSAELYYVAYSFRLKKTPVHIFPGVQYRGTRVARIDFSGLSLPENDPMVNYRFKTLGGTSQFYLTLQAEEQFWLGTRQFSLRQKAFLPLTGEVSFIDDISDEYENRHYLALYKPVFELKLNYYLTRFSPVNPFKRTAI